MKLDLHFWTTNNRDKSTIEMEIVIWDASVNSYAALDFWNPSD